MLERLGPGPANHHRLKRARQNCNFVQKALNSKVGFTQVSPSNTSNVNAGIHPHRCKSILHY